MSESTEQLVRRDRKVLALLVRAWYRRLERELEIADEALGDSVERSPDLENYVGPADFLGKPTTEEARRDPANWHKRRGQTLVLSPLRMFRDELEEAARDLECEP